MANYVSNKPIGCDFCGNGSIKGREFSRLDRYGNTIVECKWTCGRCERLVKRDSKTIPPAKT